VTCVGEKKMSVNLIEIRPQNSINYCFFYVSSGKFIKD
jgi:hypothetical protein